METLGDRVRRGRYARGWSTYRAADQATGIPVETWKNIETRGKDPQLTTVQRLVKALKIPAEELVNAPVGRVSRNGNGSK